MSSSKLPRTVLARVGVSTVLLAGLLGFASMPAPGLAALRAAGADGSFASVALWPNLLCWIAASLALGLIPSLRARALSLPVHPATLAGTLVLLTGATWMVHHALASAKPLITLSLPSLLPAVLAGLPVVLGVSLANDRWGLGQGVSLTLGGLLVHSLATNPQLRADPARGAVVVLTIVLAAALAWLFTRPKLLLERWRRSFPKADASALAREAAALFRRTLLRSALLVVVIQLLICEELPALTVTMLAALIIDLRDELKLRVEHPDLDSIDAPAELVSAESLTRALLLERRTALVQGRHHRALYRALDSWIPARLLVGSEDRARAEQLCAELRSSNP